MDPNQTDKRYELIKKVTGLCSDISHVEMCKELIDNFEKKSPPEYLVKSLRELLNIHEQSVVSSQKKTEKYTLDDRAYELFLKGNSMKEIANMLNQKQHVVTKIINNKMKSVKKKLA